MRKWNHSQCQQKLKVSKITRDIQNLYRENQETLLKTVKRSEEMDRCNSFMSGTTQDCEDVILTISIKNQIKGFS